MNKNIYIFLSILFISVVLVWFWFYQTTSPLQGLSKTDKNSFLKQKSEKNQLDTVEKFFRPNNYLSNMKSPKAKNIIEYLIRNELYNSQKVNCSLHATHVSLLREQISQRDDDKNLPKKLNQLEKQMKITVDICKSALKGSKSGLYSWVHLLINAGFVEPKVKNETIGREVLKLLRSSLNYELKKLNTKTSKNSSKFIKNQKKHLKTLIKKSNELLNNYRPFSPSDVLISDVDD